MSTECLDPKRNIWGVENICTPFTWNLRHAAGVWCIINAVVGFAGNLLTILAIPYACWKRKFNLNNNWTTTVFIVNLAVSDLLYCAINLPIYALQYMSTSPPFSFTVCIWSAVFRYVNAFADWMSLAMIALTRCLWITKSLEWNEKYFGGWRGYLIIATIWIYANVLLVPIYLERFGKFGYNCMLGKCDFMPKEKEEMELDPRRIMYGIAFTVPCIITTISYAVIWWYVHSAGKFLKKSGPVLKRVLQKRDIRMTTTLFLVCFCYFLFVAPIAVANIVDYHVNKPEVHLGTHCLYWLQYSLNFVIYAARSEQYRKAYLFFLNQVKDCLVAKCLCLCSRKDEVLTTTTAMFYVNQQNPLPEVIRTCVQASNHQDNGGMINQSVISMSSGGPGPSNESSAVVVFTRTERRRRKKKELPTGPESDQVLNELAKTFITRHTNKAEKTREIRRLSV